MVFLLELFPQMRDLDPPEIKDILSCKETLQIIDSIKFILYITNFIFVFILRKHIIREEEESPLLSIDDHLNEDLYKNIIKQSQNPNDMSLHLEYNRIYSMSRQRNSGSLQNDPDMDKTDENINNINSNNSKMI